MKYALRLTGPRMAPKDKAKLEQLLAPHQPPIDQLKIQKMRLKAAEGQQAHSQQEAIKVLFTFICQLNLTRYALQNAFDTWTGNDHYRQ